MRGEKPRKNPQLNVVQDEKAKKQHTERKETGNVSGIKYPRTLRTVERQLAYRQGYCSGPKWKKKEKNVTPKKTGEET